MKNPGIQESESRIQKNCLKNENTGFVAWVYSGS